MQDVAGVKGLTTISGPSAITTPTIEQQAGASMQQGQSLFADTTITAPATAPSSAKAGAGSGSSIFAHFFEVLADGASAILHMFDSPKTRVRRQIKEAGDQKDNAILGLSKVKKFVILAQQDVNKAQTAFDKHKVDYTNAKEYGRPEQVADAALSAGKANKALDAAKGKLAAAQQSMVKAKRACDVSRAKFESFQTKAKEVLDKREVASYQSDIAATVRALDSSANDVDGALNALQSETAGWQAEFEVTMEESEGFKELEFSELADQKAADDFIKMMESDS